MTETPPAVSDAERWFVAHGLPWFVEDVDERVVALLRPARLLPVVIVAGLAGVLAGVLAGTLTGGVADGLLIGALVGSVLLVGYASGPLRIGTMARWAADRVVADLPLLLPLLTRALPLLLLFMTFLFVNAEVWQVAAGLDRATLWAVVWLFALIAVGFLLTRLPEEVRRVERRVAVEGVGRACRGTPLAPVAQTLPAGRAAEPLTATQRANLVLVLLVAQAVQVVLLAGLVLAFFVVFGLLVIDADVIEAWVQPTAGDGPVPSPVTLFGWTLPTAVPVSDQLFQVSLFLSGFAGLYFTVYAVSDATYREQFFAELDDELERAIGVRAVYRALLTAADGPDDAGAPIR